MDNTLILKGKIIRQEKIWRSHKNNKDTDSKGTIYPYPKQGNPMLQKEQFIDRLTMLGKILDVKKKYKNYNEPRDCLLCDAKNVSNKVYLHDNVMWEDGLTHYVDVHDVDPTFEFKKFIFGNSINKLKKGTDISRVLKDEKKVKKDKDRREFMRLKKIYKDNETYVVIERNQLLILDALMIHGGYTKQYVDKTDANLSRYSEHAGMLDFTGYNINKIVVSAKTSRIDDGDDEIYLPSSVEDMFDYEYIFHTHPPTPKAGGRAEDGILYEFPSISDIFHFIDHHNDGNVIGSLVVAAEGMYNIRKASNDGKDINVDEDALFRAYQRSFYDIQRSSIRKYGTGFSQGKFYSVIAQNTDYAAKLNDVLNRYQMHIDYYPRKKGKNNKWYIDTLFLVFRKNKSLFQRSSKKRKGRK